MAGDLLPALAAMVPEPLPCLGAFVAVAGAAAVQSATGLGFGLIAAPVLLLIDGAFVPGAVILVGVSVAALSALRDLSHVHRGYVLAGTAGRLPGALLAAALVASLSPVAFQLIFAVGVLAAVALSVLAPAMRPSVPLVAAAGFVSGLMGTLTSVGAPPFALALQHAPPATMRATMNAVLLIGACISLVALRIWGAFGLADVLHAALIFPAAMAGFVLSRRLVRDARVARALRPAVLGLCCATSVALAARAGFALFG